MSSAPGRSGSAAKNAAGSAGSAAKNAAHSADTTAKGVADSRAVEIGARVGLACYGVTHLLIAWLALQIAFGGGGGEQANQKGAFQQLTDNTFGKILLWIIVVGFVAVGLWRLGQAIWGYRYVSDKKKQLRKRGTSAFKAVVFFTLTVLAVRTAIGSGGGGNGQQQATAGVLGLPGGQWIVGLVGLGIIVAGGSKIYAGWKKKFEDDMNMPSDQKTRQAVERTGQIGYIAKGVSIARDRCARGDRRDPVRPGEGGRARRGAALARPDPARSVAARRGGPRARRVRRVLLVRREVPPRLTGYPAAGRSVVVRTREGRPRA